MGDKLFDRALVTVRETRRIIEEQNEVLEDIQLIILRVKKENERLQSENAEYKRKLEDGELVSKDWHDEQALHDKAEIERLKLAVEGLTAENKVLHKENDELIGKIERLTEEKTESAETAVEILEQNIELQKQVDEYKSKIEQGTLKEIVRCKDCRFLEEKHYEEDGEKTYIKLVCKLLKKQFQPSDYCSYGEKRLKELQE